MSDAQTPVAWMYRCSHDNSVVLQQEKQDWAESGSGLWTETALYASPQKLTPPDGEGWYGHKFKEGTRGIWRCDCGKQLTDGENKCTNGTQNTLQSQPLTADAEDTQTHADTYPEREAHALSIPEVVSHEALEADAERYQLLSNYLISDDCQHDDAIVAARTVDQLNAALAVMKEPK